VLTVLAERLADDDAPPLGDYAEGLVRGVAAHRIRLDETIAQHSIGWSVERMPTVDRAILRIAAFEMLYVDGIDAAVAIDEAVEMAKKLSTDASPRFINGVLAHIMAAVGHLP
jgi:N utilization substance protein B